MGAVARSFAILGVTGAGAVIGIATGGTVGLHYGDNYKGRGDDPLLVCVGLALGGVAGAVAGLVTGLVVFTGG